MHNRLETSQSRGEPCFPLCRLAVLWEEDLVDSFLGSEDEEA
jgi:hypothetical protein